RAAWLSERRGPEERSRRGAAVRGLVDEPTDGADSQVLQPFHREARLDPAIDGATGARAAADEDREIRTETDGADGVTDGWKQPRVVVVALLGAERDDDGVR